MLLKIDLEGVSRIIVFHHRYRWGPFQIEIDNHTEIENIPA
jgi:hypothetical protein